MAVRSRFRDVLLPVLLIPTLIPILTSAVLGTTATLESGQLPFDALQPLIVIDGIYLILSFLLFDFVLDE
jgi:ABC-type transport system involved in cytochrome c biogenesis permease component